MPEMPLNSTSRNASDRRRRGFLANCPVNSGHLRAIHIPVRKMRKHQLHPYP